MAIGDRFERLTVCGTAFRKVINGIPTRYIYVPCICDCGSTLSPIIGALRSGNTKSCGCYCADRIRETKTKHGMADTRLYNVWLGMRRRCNNPKDNYYKDYGGRGIRVCEDWAIDYSKFHAWATSNGYAEGLTLDRIDVDGNYDPSNCRWADLATQSRNKRNNRILEAFGESKIAADWESDPRCMVSRRMILERISLGWHSQDAIATPPRKRPQEAKKIRDQIAASSSILTPYEIEVESWKQIPDYPHYEASDMGRIRSWYLRGSNRGTIAKTPSIININYPRGDERGYVSVRDEFGNVKKRRIGGLVLSAHVGPRPEGMFACHFPDPNPRNCRLDNLRWDTPRENLKDKTRLNHLLTKMILDAR